MSRIPYTKIFRVDGGRGWARSGIFEKNCDRGVLSSHVQKVSRTPCTKVFRVKTEERVQLHTEYFRFENFRNFWHRLLQSINLHNWYVRICVCVYSFITIYGIYHIIVYSSVRTECCARKITLFRLEYTLRTGDRNSTYVLHWEKIPMSFLGCDSVCPMGAAQTMDGRGVCCRWW